MDKSQCEAVAPYFSFRQELSIKYMYNNTADSSSIIYGGDRVIIPRALRSSFLSQLHEGHTGEVKMG